MLRGAEAVVVGNTGPAHLAAAVGTPVVSLFAPVVPAARWHPWGVPHVLLGDQEAACRGDPLARVPDARSPLPVHGAHRAWSRPRSASSPTARRPGTVPGSRKGRMRILIWHVHGSWTTAFVAGPHDYVLPLLPDRSRDGLGRARTWSWPRRLARCRWTGSREEPLDLVVLQRPHEAALAERLTGRRPGRDLPAVYLEHNAPTGTRSARCTRSSTDPALRGIPVVHVTFFNAMAWDCGESADDRHRARRA